jgi:hypothetical protein
VRTKYEIAATIGSLVMMTIARQGSAAEQTPSVAPPEPTADRRLELRPFVGWAAAENSTVGGFLGGDVSYRLHRNWAIGADAALFSPFDGSGGSAPKYPLNETDWSVNLDAALLPWAPAPRPGAVEVFVLFGTGVVRTHPVSVIDPANRHFEDKNLIQLSPGIGLRVYLSPALSLSLELRDTLYLDQHEAAQVAPGSESLPPTDKDSPKNPVTWYSPANVFTQCFQARLGIGWLAL